MRKAQLKGPCTLCGSKRSSSSWRRLPKYTKERAGKAACNACYVSVAKQAKEDEDGVPEALELRCALQASPASCRQRKQRAPSKKRPRSTLPSRPPAPRPAPKASALRSLLAVLEGEQAQPAAGPLAGSPAADSAEGSSSRVAVPAAAAPLRRSVRRRLQQQREQRQEEQQQQQIPPAPLGQQLPSMPSPGVPAVRQEPQVQGSPALSSAPPTSSLVAARVALDRQLNNLQRASSLLAGRTAAAADQAMLTVRQVAGSSASLVCKLPAVELLLLGANRAPQPVGALLVTVQRPAEAQLTLVLVLYCPHTGRVLGCRQGLRQEEGRLYLHPRHGVPTWDSSEAWKLLFREESEDGLQARLFRVAVARFGAQGPASAASGAPLDGCAIFPELQQAAAELPALLGPSPVTWAGQLSPPLQQSLPLPQQAWQAASPATTPPLPAQQSVMPQQWALSPPQQPPPQQWAAPAAWQQQQVAPLSAEPMPGLEPADGSLQQGAVVPFGSSGLPFQHGSPSDTEQLGSAIMLHPAAPAGQQWAGSSQAAAAGAASPPAQPAQQLQQELLLSDLLATLPTQPLPPLPLPPQQAPLVWRGGAAQVWPAAGAQSAGASAAGSAPLNIGSSGSQEQALGGQPAAAAAPADLVVDELLLEELGLSSLDEAALLDGLNVAELDGLLSGVWDEQGLGGAAVRFEF